MACRTTFCQSRLAHRPDIFCFKPPASWLATAAASAAIKTLTLLSGFVKASDNCLQNFVNYSTAPPTPQPQGTNYKLFDKIECDISVNFSRSRLPRCIDCFFSIYCHQLHIWFLRLFWNSPSRSSPCSSCIWLSINIINCMIDSAFADPEKLAAFQLAPCNKIFGKLFCNFCYQKGQTVRTLFRALNKPYMVLPLPSSSYEIRGIGLLWIFNKK